MLKGFLSDVVCGPIEQELLHRLASQMRALAGQRDVLLSSTAYSCLSGCCGLQMRALAEMENSGVVPLLEGDKYEDLQRMYLLFKRVEGGLDLARGMLSEHLKSSGKALIMDPERTKDPVEFVHRLLSEKDKYDR